MKLHNKKIILGITGSIAATKSCALAKLLISQGADFKIILTKSSEYFVKSSEVAGIVGEKNIYTEAMFFQDEMAHIELAKFAEIILLAPASANFIARLSHGFADDLLSAVCLASRAQIIIAPAMNQGMWHNKFTQENIQKLKRNSIRIIGPAFGSQACGDVGMGRMEEPESIITTLMQDSNLLKGKKVIITAGATIEKIDPVRYISNFSSGKMGYALAQAAREAGAEVFLITGKSNVDVPFGVHVNRVETSEEMLDMTIKHISDADIFIAAAAVSDFTPVVMNVDKVKKKGENWAVELKQTQDILKTVANLKNKPFVVGFAAETENLESNARDKLIKKNLDMIVANSVKDGAVFGKDDNEVLIYMKDKHDAIFLSRRPKIEIAREIINILATH